jgi:hypothetical protein
MVLGLCLHSPAADATAYAQHMAQAEQLLTEKQVPEALDAS